MPHKNLSRRQEYTRSYQQKRRFKLASARWNERCQRIANRSKIPDLDCAWAAGHFEGEGTVTLTRGGRVMLVRPLVSLSSTDKAAVDFFHERWPGNRRSFIPKSISGNVRTAHTWNLNAGECIQMFLLDIFPHVRTQRVREKIEIVLADIEDRGLYQQQPESRVRSEERRLIIRKLNAKGLAAQIDNHMQVTI